VVVRTYELGGEAAECPGWRVREGGDLAAAGDRATGPRRGTGAGEPSLSAFITAAVEEKLERDDLRAALDGIFRDAPLTDQERAWADRTLGLA